MTDWTQQPPPRSLGGRMRAADRGAESMLAGELDAERRRDDAPTWADGGAPDPERYLASECFVAGALSTMEPFRHYHPAWCLPFARQALDALSEWEPDQ